MKRDKFYGICSLSYDDLLQILTGKLRLEIPKGVRIHSIRENFARMSLDVLLESDHRIPGYTYETEEGAEVPLSRLTMEIIRQEVV